MITLLAVILKLSFESRIRLSKQMERLSAAVLFFAIPALVCLTLKGYCSTLIALYDLIAAVSVTVLFLKQLRAK